MSADLTWRSHYQYYIVFSVQSCFSSLLTIFPPFPMFYFLQTMQSAIYSMQDCINLQTDVSRLSDWCTTWNLLLNEEKCSAMRFMPRLSPISFHYHLNGKQISSKTAQKDLGLLVSADLTWRSHYQLISSRAYRMLGLLRRVSRSSALVSAKRSLYISLVRSQLLYCSPVWHPYLLKEIKCLE